MTPVTVLNSGSVVVPLMNARTIATPITHGSRGPRPRNRHERRAFEARSRKARSR